MARTPASIRAAVSFALMFYGLLEVLEPSELWSQGRWKVEGRVFDEETRMPIPGVNVIVRGERIGAATDTTGYFALEFTSHGTRVIVFSHIAYKKVAYEVSPDSTTLVGGLIYLIPDTLRFSEVLVHGKRQIVPSKSAEVAALHNIGGDEFERLGEEDMERALRHFLPFVIARREQRLRFDWADFTLYVNGEFKESYFIDEMDPFNIRRVMVWSKVGVNRNIDLFPIGMPLIRGRSVVLIETKER